MRGHTKLFVLQMNPDRSKQLMNAASSGDVCFGLRLNEDPSLQRILSPPIVVSARQ